MFLGYRSELEAYGACLMSRPYPYGRNGRYVAIFQSRIVDEDQQLSELVNRFFTARPEWKKEDGVFFIWTCDEPPAGVASVLVP
jgi:hypothetical protein